MKENDYPILMVEEYWRNSMLSIARIYGQINFNGHLYVIVNKHGETLFEISERMDKEGKDGMAILPGEPADLVLSEWIPVYRRLGRDRVIELINNHVPLKEANKLKNKS